MKTTLSPISIAVLTLLSGVVCAESSTESVTATMLAPVVVMGVADVDPLVVETNPKAPRQPLPAHDGADFLKTIPGFAVTRKGGTDGDLAFRGLSGSRLGILVDGQTTLGGCNMRMDAPTAYIFPEAYDHLTVVKGPQTVLYGSGNTAGTIRFDRAQSEFAAASVKGNASLLLASAGRHDEVVDATLGAPTGYVRVTGTNSKANDYADGDGNKVHAQYHRYSANVALGWTPDESTLAELSAIYSDGKAAYADRGMDGTKFLRTGAAVKLEKRHLNAWLSKLTADVYTNSVDHIMDDQELRTPGTMGYANLKRDTTGIRAAAALRTGENGLLEVGLDAMSTAHQSRMAGTNGVYSAWADDATIRQTGLFGEWRYALSEPSTLIAGARVDRWSAKDERTMLKSGMSMVANPTSGHERTDNLQSGFVRFEEQIMAPVKVYAGIGYSSRFPDYWELIAKESASSKSAFDTAQPEKARQFDTGLIYQAPGAKASVSAFYNKTADFILIDYTSMMKMSGYTRNVDATLYGAEVAGEVALNSQWKLDGSLAYTHGNNETDHTPLAQIAPLEARLGLTWDNQQWSVSGLLRGVAAQTRFDANRGNIVGKDLGASAGFAIASLNASWRASKQLTASAGVDNLFDRTYAEFISRAGGNGMGGSIPGYVQTTRVNEPGRTLWIKGNWSF